MAEVVAFSFVDKIDLRLFGFGRKYYRRKRKLLSR